MIERGEHGKLVFKSLDVEIEMGEVFEKCKTEHEVEWVMENITSIVECEAERRMEELEDEED